MAEDGLTFGVCGESPGAYGSAAFRKASLSLTYPFWTYADREGLSGHEVSSLLGKVVELNGVEPSTSTLRTWRSTN